MKATSEFIKFDDEDHGNTDYEGGVYPYGIHRFQKDHMLFLCYYEPKKEGTYWCVTFVKLTIYSWDKINRSFSK